VALLAAMVLEIVLQRTQRDLPTASAALDEAIPLRTVRNSGGDDAQERGIAVFRQRVLLDNWTRPRQPQAAARLPDVGA
jgi:hypothetical protein